MTEDKITEIIKDLKPILKSRIEEANSFIGKKFCKLTILDIPGRSSKRKCIMAKCLCDCGEFTIAALSDIKRLHTTSCGCRLIARKNIHGESVGPRKKASCEYTAWSRIRGYVKRLCNNFPETNQIDYMCLRWLEKGKGYLNFLEDMGRKPPKSQFKKCDENKIYEKDNCYWRVSKLDI